MLRVELRGSRGPGVGDRLQGRHDRGVAFDAVRLRKRAAGNHVNCRIVIGNKRVVWVERSHNLVVRRRKGRGNVVELVVEAVPASIW